VDASVAATQIERRISHPSHKYFSFKTMKYALLNRGKLHAQNLGYKKLYMHCLAENQIMTHLARKAGMQVVTEYGEADAHVALNEATYGDLAQEFIGVGICRTQVRQVPGRLTPIIQMVKNLFLTHLVRLP
jgi:hypothetical protein